MFLKFLKWLFNSGRIDALNFPLTYNDLNFNILPGTNHSLSEIDALDLHEFVRKYALYLDDFLAFNQVVSKEYFFGKLIERKVKPTKFEAGNTFYLPSTDETALQAFSNHFSSKDETINNYLAFQNTDEEKIFKTAIKRASGSIGEHYGTNSLIFLSPNNQLIGASDNRTELINNEKQYQVNWGADVWKCNIFIHDVVYDAGFKPEVMDNQHYITAGQLHQSDKFEALDVELVKPGNIVQLFSGQGANQSHNLVLTSFIELSTKTNGNELWQFKALGAEEKGAAVSLRKYEVVQTVDSYKIIEARFEQIRFFKPKYKRDEDII